MYQRLYEVVDDAISDCQKINSDLGGDYFQVVEVSIEVV